MPEFSRQIEPLLKMLKAAVSDNELDAAQRLSKALHDQVINLDAQTSRSVLAGIADILDCAHQQRRALREQLRQQRSARNAVNLYQHADQAFNG